MVSRVPRDKIHASLQISEAGAANTVSSNGTEEHIKYHQNAN